LKKKTTKDLASKGGKFTQGDVWLRYEAAPAAAKPTRQINNAGSEIITLFGHVTMCHSVYRDSAGLSTRAEDHHPRAPTGTKPIE
jgi:hypothetical protein